MILKKFAALATLLVSASFANANNLSFTGNFTFDNQVQSFTFVVGSASNVTLRSYSYAGGVNAAGTTIARGGFDPILSLFNASGARITEQDDAGCGLVAADSVTHQCWDVDYNAQLAAGTYTVSIQQYDNFSNGSLSTGYARDGLANQNFRSGFIDAASNKRDGHWAFDILNVQSAVANPPSNVPEPASLSILAIGAAGLAIARRRRNGSAR